MLNEFVILFKFQQSLQVVISITAETRTGSYLAILCKIQVFPSQVYSSFATLEYPKNSINIMVDASLMLDFDNSKWKLGGLDRVD